jgi:hypothetical protein
MNKFLLLYVCIYVLLSIVLFDPKLHIGGDNARYIILAESIVSGKGYKDMYLPEEPPHTQYPPGFPLLLALPILVFGSNVIIMKFIVLFTGIGALFFMYKICESLFKEKVTIVMPFYLSIPIFITFNHWLLSEMPFLCFTFGALYFLLNARSGKGVYYYISFVFALYAFFIRTVGISLIIAMLLFLVLNRQYKYCGIFLLIFLAAAVPWQIRNATVQHGPGYIDQLLAKAPDLIESDRVGLFDLMVRARNNFVYYFLLKLPQTLLASAKLPSVLSMLGGSIFIVLTVIGFIKRMRDRSVIEYYFLFGVPLLLCWPYVWATERFLLPILPLLVIYIYFGLFWLGEKIKLTNFVRVVTAIFIFLNVLSIFSQARASVSHNIEYLKGDKYAGYPRDWRNYFEIIESIKRDIPEDKIIMARKPEFVYLLADHKSFIYPFSKNYNEVSNAIKRSDYIIIDNLDWLSRTTKAYLLPVLQREPEHYRPIMMTSEPLFFLLEVIK